MTQSAKTRYTPGAFRFPAGTDMTLVLDNVRVRYGQHTAVDGVSLRVERGEIVGLLGPNGSGKSSTLSVAAGVIDPTTGSTTIDGTWRIAEPAAYARKVGLVPQEPALYDELSALANLRFFGRLYGLAGNDLHIRVERVLNRVRLADRAADRVCTYSGGMKQRLNLAVALLHDPVVLLLDEPTAALDPASRDALFVDLHELRETGHAILLTTHHLDEAEHGCDRVAVLNAGKLVASGKPQDLVRRSPTDRPVLYAHLREALPSFFVRGLKQRVDAGVEVEVVGRRLRLSAPNHEALGRALALIMNDGIVLDTFRTPPGRLETLARGPIVGAPSVPAPGSTVG